MSRRSVIIFSCDRCGTEKEGNRNPFESKLWFRTSLCEIGTSGDAGAKETVSLCDKCANSLYDWWTGVKQ